MKTEILLAERERALQALQESEQRYKRLLAATTDYIYTVQVENGLARETQYGPGSTAVTGYSPGEFANDPYLWYRIIHEEDRPSVLAQIERIFHGETPAPLEHRIIHKDGVIRWIKNTPIPHRDSQGRLVAYDGLIADITERKHAEELLRTLYAVTCELAESPSLLEALPGVLRTLCAILLWDHATYWAFDGASQTLRRQSAWLRHSPGPQGCLLPDTPPPLPAHAGLVGQVWAEGHPIWISDLAKEKERLSLSLPEGATFRCACACPVRVRRELSGVFELFSREPWHPDPHMLEVLASVGNLIGEFIERKASEAALRDSQERLALVIEGSNDGVWDWNVSTGETYFSPRWKSMLGYANHEIANTFKAWLELIHPEDRELALASLRRYFAGQTPTYELEHRLCHKQGGYRWILARGAVQRDRAGQPIRMAGSHVDLTDRKLAAERLEKANADLARREKVLKKFVGRLKILHRKLHEAQAHLIQAARFESIGTLAAGVAHEVKNPLQTILMGVDYFSRKLPVGDCEIATTLGDMRDAVTRANTIVGDLLTMSAMKDFHPAVEDYNGTVLRALHLVQNQLDATHVEVVLELAAVRLQVEIDRNKVQQVFINLFINAKQAMPSGGTLTLRTRLVGPGDSESRHDPIFHKFSSEQPLAVAEVQDTGTGIKPEDLRRIFDPFFTTKPPGEGNGLGLPVAKRIIDLHGGAIDLNNVPGGGVVARVILRAVLNPAVSCQPAS